MTVTPISLIGPTDNISDLVAAVNTMIGRFNNLGETTEFTISSGTIDDTIIGDTTPAAGTFTDLKAQTCDFRTSQGCTVLFDAGQIPANSIGTGNLSVTNVTIGGSITAAGHATTKSYVDGIASSINSSISTTNTNLSTLSNRVDSMCWNGISRFTASTALSANTHKGRFIEVSTASGNVTVTLPDLASVTEPFNICISKDTLDTNKVIIDGFGTQTVDKNSTLELLVRGSVSLLADKANLTWIATNNTTADNSRISQLENLMVNEVVFSDVSEVSGSTRIMNIIALTQAQYDAIPTKLSTTLYVIKDV